MTEWRSDVVERVRSYRDLDVWNHAMTLVAKIYSLTKSFPSQETYGLVSQMRRAAVSVPSNIAEGSGRKTSKEFAQFVNMSSGSLCELETQLLIAHMLGYIAQDEQDDILKHIASTNRMLRALAKSLRERA